MDDFPSWRRDESALARFTRDLTAEARAGRLEPVRCRADEVARVIDILLRQGKNNPTLVGAAGVGKTAIVEGLAQRVATGDVPLALRDVRILALDHVALLGGAMYRGQYEERIRAIVDETTAAGDVVLFIDELHNLIGQGTAMGAAMDAANMLKPALVRGDFRVVGATTDDEYQRWVLGDPALERRFQKVAVRELGTEETLDILRARQRRLERHHNVLIADEALAAAVALTDQHVRDRVRPDKAIDALDEACAHLQGKARHGRETEALIVARRQLLRTGGAARVEDPGDAVDDDEDTAAPATPDDDDPLTRLAQDGFGALERFGAEIEALFVGGPRPARGAESREPSARGDAAPGTGRRRARGEPPSLADLETALDRRLMEEGQVVRAHDVARVVGLMVGRPITWTD
jgi:ATP-dependent Clp protease ATP-binding subunit ClpA